MSGGRCIDCELGSTNIVSFVQCIKCQLCGVHRVESRVTETEYCAVQRV